MNKVKEMVLSYLKDEDVCIVLFGSRARGDSRSGSDMDIGIAPRNNKPLQKGKLTLLREALENSNIPYKVEIVELSEVSETFRVQAMKDAVVWKD